MGNKKGSYRYHSSKRTTRENVGLLRNGAGALMTKDTEKAEALNAFFTSAFTAKMVLKVSGAPERVESPRQGRLGCSVSQH